MSKKLTVLLSAALVGILSTGCVSVVEGQKVFTVSASKMLIGPSIADVEAAVPDGATITDVYVWDGILGLGLLSQASISGTK